MMKRTTSLEALEKVAERQWEKRAKQLVQAIAEREHLDADELYPYLIDYSFGDGYMDASFKLPGHTVIKLFGGYGDRPPLNLTENGLEGDYGWMVFVSSEISTPRFTGCGSLGEALLLARWSYQQDDRALWR